MRELQGLGVVQARIYLELQREDVVGVDVGG